MMDSATLFYESMVVVEIVVLFSCCVLVVFCRFCALDYAAVVVFGCGVSVCLVGHLLMSVLP